MTWASLESKNATGISPFGGGVRGLIDLASECVAGCAAASADEVCAVAKAAAAAPCHDLPQLRHFDATSGQYGLRPEQV